MYLCQGSSASPDNTQGTKISLYFGYTDIYIRLRLFQGQYDRLRIPSGFGFVCVIILYLSKNPKAVCMGFIRTPVSSLKLSRTPLQNQQYRSNYETERVPSKQLHEKDEFTEGKGCVSFILKLLIHTHPTAAFTDLEQDYCTVDRKVFWKVLWIFGAEGNMPKEAVVYFQDSKASVRTNWEKC